MTAKNYRAPSIRSRSSTRLLGVTGALALGAFALAAAPITPLVETASASQGAVVQRTPDTTSGVGVPMPVRPAGEPDYRFLSSPDFMNADVANLKSYGRHRPGMPNSWNASWAYTVSTIMDQFAAEKPADVLVAGDLVNGHWIEDERSTRVFGRYDQGVNNTRAALKRAADFYYTQWRIRFERRGLDVHAGIGDHELGDNPWRGSPRTDLRRSMGTTFKGRFAANLVARKHYPWAPPGPAHGTAFATMLDPEMLLVSIDPFLITRTDIEPRVDPQQLRWIDKTLARAKARGVDWIVVQGHLPIATPVRKWGSSSLHYQGGVGSPLWKVMARNDVDIYLNGEVHNITFTHQDGISQISHGGIVGSAPLSGQGGTNYVLGEIFGDQMFLRVNRFAAASVDRRRRLWQMTSQGAPPLFKRVAPNPPIKGQIVLTKDNQVLYRDQAFLPWDGKGMGIID